MRVNNVVDRIEVLGQNKYVQWGIWGAYTLLIMLLCSIHEPWIDEHKVWNMVYRLSMPDLLRAMRLEGHFCLWHLCVWPFVRLFNMDYHALYIASVTLMSVAVWLMIFKLDFSFIGKLFIIFSAPFFYFFPVIARCYALIPPILIGMAIVYQQKKNPFLYCFLVGLLAHTHVFMEGMVGIVWCLFVYYYVYIPYKNKELQRVKKNAWASLITVLLVILAFVQIMGGIIDAANGTSVACKVCNTPSDWMTYVYDKHHLYITTWLHDLVLHIIPDIDFALTMVLYVIITVLLYKLIHQSQHKAECTWTVTVSIFWQIIFGFTVYFMWFQRIYLLYLPILYVMWMIYQDKVSVRKYAIYIVLFFWLLNTPAQCDRISRDITEEYCFNASAAKQIEQHITEDYPIISYADETSWLVRKNILFVYDNNAFENVLQHAYANDSVLYVITLNDLFANSTVPYAVEPIFSTVEGNNVFSEHGDSRKEVTLYQITRHERHAE